MCFCVHTACRVEVVVKGHTKYMSVTQERGVLTLWLGLGNIRSLVEG